MLEFNARSVTVPVVRGERADLGCILCHREPGRNGLVSVCGHIYCDDCFPDDPSERACPCGARLVYKPQPCQLLMRISEGSTGGAGRTGSPDWCAPCDEDVEEEPALLTTQPLPAPSCTRSAPLAQPMSKLEEKATAYVHFGVSCDGCGVFPIVGRAYRCRDCPEQVGYDLCQYCYSDTLHGSHAHTGRFGQSHRADHSMEERLQARTWLHDLQARHPGMSIHAVLRLAQMQADE